MTTSLPTEALPAADQQLHIDVWSDLECPWCYIGKHRLDQAIAASPYAAAITVRPHSYQLDPTLPERAVPNVERLAAKYGLSQAQAAEMDGRAAAIAHREGLPFVADRLLANSIDVHRVLHLAESLGRGYELLGALQHTLFSGGANIFDHGVLAEVASGLGIDRVRVEEVLSSDEYAAAVRADQEQARRLGVTGIPFTVLDERIAIPGSTTVEGFAAAIQKAWSGRSAK